MRADIPGREVAGCAVAGLLAGAGAAGHGGAVLGLVLGGLAGAGVYAVSLRINPWWPHRRCRGTGRHHGRVYDAASRDCGSARCRNGRVLRWGVRVFQPGRARDLAGR